MTEFEGFPKMARLNRDCIITEKLDGTNAQIMITDDGQLMAGSRSRWITPEDDNFGFAQWAHENKDELMKLGPGRHFGEWWGQGIQRKYGLDEKRFSLFNTHRWGEERPECCDVVPILYSGPFDTKIANDQIEFLKESGSVAAPGFMNPEGIVIFHVAANLCFKVTVHKDEKPKSMT